MKWNATGEYGPQRDIRYEVQWQDGKVTGTLDVIAILEDAVGTEVIVLPSGPGYVLDLADPASVYAALDSLTRLRRVTGQVPTIEAEPDPPNATVLV